MKKIVSFVLLISFILICNTVFADMGVPNSRAYKIKVENQNGVDALDWEFDENGNKIWHSVSHLNYGDEIIIMDESKIDGKTYLHTYLGAGMGQTNAYFLKDDVTEVEWNLNDFTFKESENLTVLYEEGVTIYEWPGKRYQKLGAIPYMTTMQAKGVQEYDEWYYITYNGISGWICGFSGALGRKVTDKEFMTLCGGMDIKGVNMESVENDKGYAFAKTIGHIKGNTIISEYYSTDPWTRMFYVTYNGINGYIRDDVAYSSNIDLEKYGTYTVDYDEAVLIGTDNSVTEVPKGTVLNCTYYYVAQASSEGIWFFTNYNGKEGWILAPFYENGEDIKRAVDERIAAIKLEEENSDRIESQENVQENTNTDTNSVQTSSKTEDLKEKATVSPTQLILLCVLCALVASFTTAVIVILVNKKK